MVCRSALPLVEGDGEERSEALGTRVARREEQNGKLTTNKFRGATDLKGSHAKTSDECALKYSGAVGRHGNEFENTDCKQAPLILLLFLFSYLCFPFKNCQMRRRLRLPLITAIWIATLALPGVAISYTVSR